MVGLSVYLLLDPINAPSGVEVRTGSPAWRIRDQTTGRVRWAFVRQEADGSVGLVGWPQGHVNRVRPGSGPTAVVGAGAGAMIGGAIGGPAGAVIGGIIGLLLGANSN